MKLTYNNITFDIIGHVILEVHFRDDRLVNIKTIVIGRKLNEPEDEHELLFEEVVGRETAAMNDFMNRATMNAFGNKTDHGVATIETWKFAQWIIECANNNP